MQIAYINIIMSDSSSIANKLDNQAKIAIEENIPIDYFWITGPNGPKEKEYSHLKIISSQRKNPFILRNWQGSVIKKLLKKYDRIILRYPLFDPVLFFKLDKKETNRIILDHHTKEVPELKIKKDVRWITESLFGSRWIKDFRAIIGVTNDIIDYEAQRSNFSGKTGLFTNAINLDSYPEPKDIVMPDEKRIQAIMAMSETAIWHGLENIIEKLKILPESFPFHLHIIGKMSYSYINAIQHFNNITYHGVKKEHELPEIYNKMNIGIGSFNIQSNLLTEAAPLKVRGYLANGLPVILGCKDSAIPDTFPFALRLREFDPTRITDFVKSIENVQRSDIKKAAAQYIDAKELTYKLYKFCCEEI